MAAALLGAWDKTRQRGFEGLGQVVLEEGGQQHQAGAHDAHVDLESPRTASLLVTEIPLVIKRHGEAYAQMEMVAIFHVASRLLERIGVMPNRTRLATHALRVTESC
jgi:hypothetical protein